MARGQTKGEAHGDESNEAVVIGHTSSHDNTILLVAFTVITVSPEHTGRTALFT